MNIHSSKSLVFVLTDGELVGFNFLLKSGFSCTSSFMDVLLASHGADHRIDLERMETSDWLELGAFIGEGTEQDKAEKEFVDKWEWGLPAALYHFAVQGNEYRSLEDGEIRQRDSLERHGMPELACGNRSYECVHPLAKTVLETPLLATMAARRSNREPASSAVDIETVGRLLYAGLGITGFTSNSVVELPLKMTPSGGARNPYEADVFARNIIGLDPGIYHYSALEHSLGKLEAPVPDSLASIVGGQNWADNMAGVIVLAAHFERTMWKYDDPNAYRVILIEAGHIGQNMLLAATEERMAACPTAALDHNLLFDLLDLPSRVMCAPIYAIAFGSSK